MGLFLAAASAVQSGVPSKALSAIFATCIAIVGRSLAPSVKPQAAGRVLLSAGGPCWHVTTNAITEQLVSKSGPVSAAAEDSHSRKPTNVGTETSAPVQAPLQRKFPSLAS